MIEGRGRVGPTSDWIKEKDLADDSQGMRASLLRRDEKFEAIAEKEQSNFIVISDGAESEETGNFRGQLAL